ncbi:hypothetical protein Ocin01_15155 [Orchesella cincta]|uniref:Lipocalin/cytosolic fatty-acid binding domain-containing protein n=1 Tax=Orchesella cincta TaxID=48709 RepID=A0A1D2MF58_ORCCI|nr:hypothetical protein Ocin01_15155 [Orchesella cincta]
MWYSAPLALLCMSSAIQGLSLETVKEQPCFNISKNPTPLLDAKWALSLDTIYYPLMNTVDLYRAATDLLQMDPKEINTGSIYYDGCLTWQMFSNGTLMSKGYNGLTRAYKTKTEGDNLDIYTFEAEEGDAAYSGTVYTTLTDNKSYFFSAVCLNDGEMAWGVGSLTPTLPEETKKTILEHAESLGFKKEFFTELRYDKCNL